MSRDNRRLFTSPEMASRFQPPLLLKLLARFRALLEAAGFVFSDPKLPVTIDYAGLVTALATAARSASREADELADALFFISLLATPKNRRLLADEIRARNLVLNMQPDLSDADFVLSVWLIRPELLEAAAARITLKSRRSFAYFPPSDTGIAAGIGPFTDVMKEKTVRLIRSGLASDGRARGLTLIPFLESPDEDCFLIRRSRFPERITYHDDDGNEVHQSVWMRAYDVILFDRRTGLLKINTRDNLEELYRTAFGSVYAGALGFFEKRDVFTLDALRSAAADTLDCKDVPDLRHVALEEVKYFTYEDGVATRHVIGTKDWYAEHGGRRAPVPPEAERLDHAQFSVTTKWRKTPMKCRVHTGNVMAYSRDEESATFEAFLRLRGMMRNVQLLVRKAA